eukprot:495663_1
MATGDTSVDEEPATAMDISDEAPVFQFSERCTSKDESMSHITGKDVDTIRQSAQNVNDLLMSVQQKQNKLGKAHQPTYACKEFYEHSNKLFQTCNPIMIKPKPEVSKKDS